MGRYIHRKRGKEREEKKREKKQTNKKNKETQRENNSHRPKCNTCITLCPPLDKG